MVLRMLGGLNNGYYNRGKQMTEPTTMSKPEQLQYENLWESLEDLVYENCNKDTLNFDEYEAKYGIDLRKHLSIVGISKCVSLLNQTTLEENPND